MTTPTERQSLQRCPSCNRARVLKVDGTRESGQRHECISCGYLVYWKPFAKWTPEDHTRALEIQEKYVRTQRQT